MKNSLSPIESKEEDGSKNTVTRESQLIKAASPIEVIAAASVAVRNPDCENALSPIVVTFARSILRKLEQPANAELQMAVTLGGI